MGDLPLTRIALPEDRQLAIREAVRAATGIGFDNAPSRTATLDDLKYGAVTASVRVQSPTFPSAARTVGTSSARPLAKAASKSV